MERPYVICHILSSLDGKITGPFMGHSTKVHVKAMKFLISFMVFFILHFVGLSIEVLCFILPQNKLLFITGLTDRKSVV